MTAAATRLYTPEMLGLATGLARYPLDRAMPFQGKARSPSCGSSLEMSLALDPAERIERLGLLTQACAIGQASAALFAAGAVGIGRTQLVTVLAEIEAWLGGGPLPEWPGLAAIAPARAFPGRHGAILLPWRAALDALPS